MSTPPPYVAGFVDQHGIHVPTFASIEADAVAKYQGIFGQDCYLGNDSQDYQDISVRASYISDLYQMAVVVYNNQSPQTAIGTGLDNNIALNGLVRNSASYSTCPVNITGTAYTAITNGVISDGTYNWDLPASVTIGSGGTVTATATCETIGAIGANAGTLTNIVTPTYGWTSVTNTITASLGLPIETDSALKLRQSISTSIASQTLLASTMAAINAVSGVSASRPYENTTGSVDSNGAPAHSIYPVVTGGASVNIANAIYIQKNPGVFTYGTTTVPITDAYGNVMPISYFVTTPELIDVTVNITPLTGYNSTYKTTIQTAINNYINTIGIGNNLIISALWAVVSSVMPNQSSPIFSITSITAAIHGNTQGTSNITIPFNGAALANTISVVD